MSPFRTFAELSDPERESEPVPRVVGRVASRDVARAVPSARGDRYLSDAEREEGLRRVAELRAMHAALRAEREAGAS